MNGSGRTPGNRLQKFLQKLDLLKNKEIKTSRHYLLAQNRASLKGTYIHSICCGATTPHIQQEKF